ncbi:MAG: Gfo/Idh/MocA family oxidoreductase [bacterium]|nr:Gfo/Idh/MocA family oxidoreductase [bacterium]MCP4965767.1 Gfo/Idh/MocA family oxidoreductase [bacterium]
MTLRVGVVGVGAMGRHHARIWRQMDSVELVAVADPAGDPRRAAVGIPVVDTVEELVALGIDAASVAVPSNRHEAVGLELADAGVHTLIEKPVADSVLAARKLAKAFENAQLIAVVGHVERFNPALMEMRRRLQNGDLGKVYSISTRRVGPFPVRISDVGVVFDLATHDIDLIRWLCGPFETMHSISQSVVDGPHEDLVEVVGVLESGVVATMSVNWVSPVKERRVTVTGTRGAFVADLLSADLTFHENGDVPTEWDDISRLRGVTEGNRTTYAFQKREPLVSELEAFRDFILGDSDAPVVPLSDGVGVLEMAEELLGPESRPPHPPHSICR